jgi:hypothetical protein
METKKCEIIMVLDESGSMSTCKSATISGVNEFMKNQTRIEGETTFTLVKFSDYYTIVNNAVPLNQVTYLDESNYTPSNTTALLDAVGRTILSVGNRVENLPEESRPQKIIFVIITDGQENASKEFKRSGIFDMVSTKKQKNNWEFIFLGADIDAWGEEIGITFNVNIQKNDLKRSFKGLSQHVLYSRLEKLFNEDSFGLTEDQIDRNLDNIGKKKDKK